MSRHEDLAGDTLALVLAGGNGTRLGALTRWQCKPAIPFAGHYRNIDFTLSNCVNSGVRRIGVLTQYKAQTLIGHITNGWSFLPRNLGEFVDVWPAQQRRSATWYAGTADAVYQNLDLVLAQRARHTLVLAGDHVYRMDYRDLLAHHAASGADVTIACLPVPVGQAGAFGIPEVDAGGRIRAFREKPAPVTLHAPDGVVLASMGIYVFDTAYLAARLEEDTDAPDSTHDFGRDILPAAAAEDHVAAYVFTGPDGAPGFWRDVGTLQSYWQAHMELLADEPPLDLHDPEWPFWTLPQPLPPARFVCGSRRRGCVSSSMLSAGTLVRDAWIRNSVLGTSVRVEVDSVLEECVVLPGARIGAGCMLRRVIVDGDTVIPDGTFVDPAVRAAGDVVLLTRGSVGKPSRQARDAALADDGETAGAAGALLRCRAQPSVRAVTP